jgi:hypothetical protein
MARQISEADWKRLSRLEPVARDRFYQRVLSELVRLATAGETAGCERYRAVYQFLTERERELGAAFDGLRRSTALVQLARMRALGLVTDEDLAAFSPETREAVALLLNVGTV